MDLTFWTWLVAAGLLVLVEMLAPGFVFMWLGASAALVGLLVWLVPTLDWRWQLVIFALAALATVAAWAAWQRRRGRELPASTLNRRADQLVGTETVLTVGTEAGHGRVRIGDSTWLARGPALPAGSPVRIVGVAGTVLLVEPAEVSTTALPSR